MIDVLRVSQGLNGRRAKPELSSASIQLDLFRVQLGFCLCSGYGNLLLFVSNQRLRLQRLFAPLNPKIKRLKCEEKRQKRVKKQKKPSCVGFETVGVITTLTGWSSLEALRWFLKRTICQRSFGSQLAVTSICSFLFIVFFFQNNLGVKKGKTFVICPVVSPACLFVFLPSVSLAWLGTDEVTQSHVLSPSLSVSHSLSHAHTLSSHQFCIQTCVLLTRVRWHVGSQAGPSHLLFAAEPGCGDLCSASPPQDRSILCLAKLQMKPCGCTQSSH